MAKFLLPSFDILNPFFTCKQDVENKEFNNETINLVTKQKESCLDQKVIEIEIREGEEGGVSKKKQHLTRKLRDEFFLKKKYSIPKKVICQFDL